LVEQTDDVMGFPIISWLRLLRPARQPRWVRRQIPHWDIRAVTWQSRLELAYVGRIINNTITVNKSLLHTYHCKNLFSTMWWKEFRRF